MDNGHWTFSLLSFQRFFLMRCSKWPPAWDMQSWALAICVALSGSQLVAKSSTACFSSGKVESWQRTTCAIDCPQIEKSRGFKSGGQLCSVLRESTWLANLEARKASTSRVQWGITQSCWNQKVSWWLLLSEQAKPHPWASEGRQQSQQNPQTSEKPAQSITLPPCAFLQATTFLLRSGPQAIGVEQTTSHHSTEFCQIVLQWKSTKINSWVYCEADHLKWVIIPTTYLALIWCILYIHTRWHCILLHTKFKFQWNCVFHCRTALEAHIDGRQCV